MFNLNSYRAEWLDIEAVPKVTFSVELPSGIETRYRKVEMVDVGNVSDLQVTLLSPFQEVRKLFKSFIEDTKLL